jgi:hypothetical protein
VAERLRVLLLKEMHIEEGFIQLCTRLRLDHLQAL